MIEKGFVDALMKTVATMGDGNGVVIRPSDSYTLGIPDLLIWIPVRHTEATWVWSIAIEAKQLRPLMNDPFHKGRRTGQMLKHAFTGPQISMLRKMKLAGIDAFGLVRASVDIAFRIEPEDIPAKTGNFTHEELVEFGTPVHRAGGIWKFWRKNNDSNVSSSRHRDDSGD